MHGQVHCHGRVTTRDSHAISAFRDKLHPSNAVKLHSGIPCWLSDLMEYIHDAQFHCNEKKKKKESALSRRYPGLPLRRPSLSFGAIPITPWFITSHDCFSKCFSSSQTAETQVCFWSAFSLTWQLQWTDLHNYEQSTTVNKADKQGRHDLYHMCSICQGQLVFICFQLCQSILNLCPHFGQLLITPRICQAYWYNL